MAAVERCLMFFVNEVLLTSFTHAQQQHDASHLASVQNSPVSRRERDKTSGGIYFLRAQTYTCHLNYLEVFGASFA